MKKTLILGTLVSALFAVNTVSATSGACNTEAAVKKADKLWADTLALHQPDKVADLYAHDAILLGTYENIPLITHEQRAEYFAQLFKKVPNLRVEYDKVFVKLMKEDAVSSGLYTFVGTGPDGKEIRMPARYSFAYDSTNNGCELIMHHSSELPLTYTNENDIK
jgi:uncharacterized protein (TIGR02246 family)